MEVELLHWPADEQRRAQLGRDGVPRILLVDPEARPPVTPDPLEDWIRLPVDHDDLEARVSALHRVVGRVPVLDDDDVLRCSGNWVALPPVEARLVAVLVERFGKVVGRDLLLEAGWPDEEPRRNVLDVHLVRLRRRLEPLGLAITTVRKRGYVLDAG
jgi:DNA-binding response OmpR family regulator